MWLEEVLDNIPESAWRDLEKTFVTFVEGEHTVVGEIPVPLRPMLVRKRLFHGSLAAARHAVIGETTEMPDAGWQRQQLNTLNFLIATSLQHVGITIDDDKHVIGEGWKVLQIVERKIILVDDLATVLLGESRLFPSFRQKPAGR